MRSGGNAVLAALGILLAAALVLGQGRFFWVGVGAVVCAACVLGASLWGLLPRPVLTRAGAVCLALFGAFALWSLAVDSLVGGARPVVGLLQPHLCLSGVSRAGAVRGSPAVRGRARGARRAARLVVARREGVRARRRTARAAARADRVLEHARADRGVRCAARASALVAAHGCAASLRLGGRDPADAVARRVAARDGCGCRVARARARAVRARAAAGDLGAAGSRGRRVRAHARRDRRGRAVALRPALGRALARARARRRRGSRRVPRAAGDRVAAASARGVGARAGRGRGVPVLRRSRGARLHRSGDAGEPEPVHRGQRQQPRAVVGGGGARVRGQPGRRQRRGGVPGEPPPLPRVERRGARAALAAAAAPERDGARRVRALRRRGRRRGAGGAARRARAAVRARAVRGRRALRHPLGLHGCERRRVRDARRAARRAGGETGDARRCGPRASSRSGSRPSTRSRRRGSRTGASTRRTTRSTRATSRSPPTRRSRRAR